MLLVVLLSAAPTGGQPRTQIVGSAFDPATNSVVVSPKRPRVDASVKKSDHAKDRDLVSPTVTWPAPLMQPLHVRPEPASIGSHSNSSYDPAPLENPLALSHAARAPPFP